MKVIFVSSLISKEKNDYIFKNSNEKPLQSVQKFHRLFCQGFAHNDINVKTISVIPMSKTIMKKVIWFEKKEIEDGIEYCYIPFLNIKYLRQICIMIFSILFVLKELMFNNKDTYVICDILNTTISFSTNILCKLCRVKCIGIVTDLPSDINKNTISSKINQFMQSKYDGYILLTSKMNEIVNPKQKPSIVIEGFVDNKMNNYINNLKNKEKICIYAGGLSENYGIKTLVEAFSIADIKDYQLHIYGYGELEPYLKKMKDEKIKFFGMISNDEIVKKEIKASLLINPRFSNEEYTKYSFPSKILEYMSTGTPVLTTKLEGIPLNYEPFMFFFDDESLGGYKNKLEEVLSNETTVLYDKGKQAKQFVMDEKNNYKQTSKVKNWIEKYFLRKKNILMENFNLQNYCLSMIASILMMLSYLSENCPMAICALSILFITNLIYSLVNFKNIGILSFFLIAFFTFSMGQYYFANNGDFMYYKYFPNYMVVKTILLQFLSLFCISFVFTIFNILNSKKKKVHYSFDEKLKLYNKFAIIGLCITSICAFIVNIETVIRVLKYGYLVIYNGTHPSVIPSVVHYLSDSITLFLAIALATTNCGKTIKFILVIYLVNLILSLFTGARSEFVIGLFFILFYIFKSSDYFNIIRKKTIKRILIAFILILPCAIVFLNLYNRIRNKITISNINPISEISSFFVSQGRSVNILNYAQMYEKNLKTTNTNYTFGLLYKSLANKVKILSVGTLNLPIEKIEKQNLAIDVSILVLGMKKYKEGNGLGSNYLAEVYIDFGICGVVIFSVFFASTICIFNLYSYKNWIINSLSILLFGSTMFLCRGQAMEFICALTSFGFWIGVLILNILYSIHKKFYFKEKLL